MSAEGTARTAVIRSVGPPFAPYLLAAAIVCIFALSSMALERLGVPYDRDSGAAWQKIHPASYVALAALLADIFGRSRPIEHTADLARRFPGAALFVAMWVLLLVYSLFVQKTPVAVLVDNYLVVLAVVLLRDGLSSPVRRFLVAFLHGFMAANAIIALAELALHVRLFPYVINGVEVLGDYRSTSLLGHPLINAATTSLYILCLFWGGSFSPFPRAVMIALQALALVAFGGRTSIVLLGAVIALSVGLSVARVLSGAKFDIKSAMALFVAVPAAALAIVIAQVAGVFDPLIARFIDDNGSSLARVTMWRLFDFFPIEDLLFGADPAAVLSAQSTLGIDIGIESTWLAWTFQYGIAMTAFFVVGLFALWWELWRAARSGVILMFAVFFGLISSSIGLAGKTPLFCHFAVLLVVLFSNREAAVTNSLVLEKDPPQGAGAYAT